MIQRIQSVFLLLVALANAALFFQPLVKFYNEALGYVYHLYVYSMANMVPSSESIFSGTVMLPLAGGAVLIGVIALITIFMYKNRILQIKLIKFDILLNIIFVVAFFFFYAGAFERKLETLADYNIFMTALPLISLVFLVLSYRSVMKDEKKIRSADRLR